MSNIRGMFKELTDGQNNIIGASREINTQYQKLHQYFLFDTNQIVTAIKYGAQGSEGILEVQSSAQLDKDGQEFFRNVKAAFKI